MPDPIAPDTIAPVTPAEPDPAAPAEKTYTAEEHAAAVEAAIAKRFKNAPTKDELEELRAAKAERDELKRASMSEADALKAERDELKAERDAAIAKATAAELASHKAAIGAELGIPASLRSRLSGTTEEEIRADAVAVAAELKIVAPKVPAGGPTNPAPTGGAKTAEELEAMSMEEYAAYEAAQKK